MPRRREITVTEFVVEVDANGIRWNGLDAFLMWLLHKKPEGGFLPHVRSISRLRARPRRSRRAK